MTQKKSKDHSPSIPHENGLYKRLKDPEYATDYLNSILEENDLDLLLLGLRDVAKAYGFRYIAKAAGLNRESLYKALSRGKNPRISTIMEILSIVGCQIRLEPKMNIKKKSKRKAA